MVFRVLKVMAGLVLIIVGAGLFVLFTSSINVPQSMGSPMETGSPLQWWPVILVLDVIFLSLVYGGVKLAGFGWRVFGVIILVAGIGILSLGIWNHVTGPPLDYDSSRSDPNKVPVPSEMNVIVYFWAGLTILGGLFSIGVLRSKESK